MGKRDKKQRHQRHPRREASHYLLEHPEEVEVEAEADVSSSPKSPTSDSEHEGGDDQTEEGNEEVPSKFLLYQQSVQSPKGDISYLQKFFLMYVGGRRPLHLQEDFCGTALLSAEWLRSDPRRTAVGLDLDVEALNWCIKNNVGKFGSDESSRISLFHGNVLQPFEAALVTPEPQELIRKVVIYDQQASSEAREVDSDPEAHLTDSADVQLLKTNLKQIPGRDIICAFNYSCCCLHKRGELLLYFKNARNAISRKGGIFVMDLYGGTSSEQKLRLQRRFPNFTYIWEQADFDILERKTRISLHYHLQKPRKKIRHAFSYSWRLWALPEVKECLEEAGFHSVHFWLRQMPDSDNIRSVEGFGMGRDLKYEEVESFLQQDSWNAYVVAVAR